MGKCSLYFIVAISILVMAGSVVWFYEGFGLLDHPEVKSFVKNYTNIDLDPGPRPIGFPTLHATTPKNQSRSCIQCVGGNFLMNRWLMQNDNAEQKMGWPESWFGTDCSQVKKMIIFKGCKTTCLTIWLQKKEYINTNVFDGILMDCADDLIFFSHDIPNTGWMFSTDAIKFTENATYSNDRSGYRITYNFTTLSSDIAESVGRTIRDYVVPGHTPQEYTEVTYYVYCFIAVFVALLLCGLCCMQVRSMWKSRKTPQRISYYERLRMPLPTCPRHAGGVMSPIWSRSFSSDFQDHEDHLTITVENEAVAYSCSRPITPPELHYGNVGLEATTHEESNENQPSNVSLSRSISTTNENGSVQNINEQTENEEHNTEQRDTKNAGKDTDNDTDNAEHDAGDNSKE